MPKWIVIHCLLQVLVHKGVHRTLDIHVSGEGLKTILARFLVPESEGLLLNSGDILRAYSFAMERSNGLLVLVAKR